MNELNNQTTSDQEPEKKSTLRVIVHSFFVVPFLIAIFAVLVFLMVKILTVEPNTAQDYLEHVKTGGTTKRWQGAFELSKILSNPNMVPTDDRFVYEMISTYEYSSHEKDSRIRSYLAMAMGRTNDPRYTETLIKSLNDSDESVVAACAYALGLILDSKAFDHLIHIADHSDPQVRLQTIIALGNYYDDVATDVFLRSLEDPEVNVRWDAAVALAKLKNRSGRGIIIDLLDRKYLDSFSNIDPHEQDQAMLVAIQVAPNIMDSEIEKILIDLRENDQSMEVRETARIMLSN